MNDLNNLLWQQNQFTFATDWLSLLTTYNLDDWLITNSADRLEKNVVCPHKGHRGHFFSQVTPKYLITTLIRSRDGRHMERFIV